MFNTRNTSRVATTTRQERSPDARPKHLAHMAPVEIAALHYFDDAEKEHTSLAFKVGGQWYMDPEGENWAKRLRPLAPWLLTQVEAKVKVAQTTTSDKDTVDVLGSDT